MARVFISYRRSDSKWMAGRLYDRLSEVLGRDNLFFDISNIEPGEDFVARIGEIVGSCDVLLAVIGPGWVDVRDRAGRRRLENARDLVRTEIHAALQRNIRVIPLLVDGASMPEESEVPEDLAPLLRRNAHDVSFAKFHTDLDSFIRVLQRILAVPEPASRTVSPTPPPSVAARTAEPVATTLPFSISLETAGGVASTLIPKGVRLPAEASEVFTTAADNQTAVEVNLALGERPMIKDNVAVGKFQLADIPPAARGVPQIAVTARVDTALILTVTAVDQATGHKQILDAVDLTRIDVPRQIVNEPLKVAESTRDSPNDLSAFFERLFGKGWRAPDPAPAPGRLDLTLTPAEAAAGVTKEVAIAGRTMQLRFPAGIKEGQALRVQGEGPPDKDGRRGDLYVYVRVKN